LLAAKRRIKELKRTVQSTSTCSELSPELASLVEYLAQNNDTALYSPIMQIWFLSNIWSNQVPAHSYLWHPQTTGDLLTSQPSLNLLWVLFCLVVRLFNSCIAKKIAQKFQIHLTPLSNITVISFHSFLSFKLKDCFGQLFTVANFLK